MKLIIGIAALLVAVLIFLKRRSRAPVRAANDDKAGLAGTPGASRDFHAVSIRPGLFACRAARTLEGQRFLSGAAPRIPLPHCDAKDCTCRFSHHSDRRAGEDRRSLYRSSIGIDIKALGDDKRNRERRKDDRDADS